MKQITEAELLSIIQAIYEPWKEKGEVVIKAKCTLWALAAPLGLGGFDPTLVPPVLVKLIQSNRVQTNLTEADVDSLHPFDAYIIPKI